MNIDTMDKKHIDTKDLSELLLQCGFINHIKNPTRFSSTRNSCLDHIYSNSDIINDCGTLDVNISDHIPVFVNRKKNSVTPEKTKFTGRSYRRYDVDIFNNELATKPWNLFDEENNPNELWKKNCTYITNTLDHMCPMKLFSIKKYKEPWITNELLELIKDKDLALRTAKRTKKKVDWDNARTLRNECLSKIRKAKCEFVNNELNNNQNDSRKSWKNIHDIWRNKISSSSKILLVDATTGNEIPPDDTANNINKFFTGIGPNLSKDMNDPWVYDGIVADRHLKDILVTNAEIDKICKEI